jgi:basic amino acid/polyamine antiporter, APA family
MSTDSSSPPQMKKTLGLTGLTMNAMALIAPGAFLWLTFAQQSQYGAPMAGSAIWFGIVVALLLCFATAIAYAELSKLYPGAGSSYFFAEQAFLSKTSAYKFARLSKFIIGWASHLYYWVYPGVMVGVTAILVGYLAGQLFPDTFNGSVNSPTLMIGFCVLFSFGVAYIAYRGVTGTTGVNIAINVIQISALLVFSFIAIGYRLNHMEGKVGDNLDPDGRSTHAVLATFDNDGKPDPGGKPMKDPKTDEYVAEKDEQGKDKALILEYAGKGITQEPVDKEKPDGEKQDTFQFHETAVSVIAPHNMSFAIIQACIAILILVGFESVTSMGEEAKNAKRDIPRAVLLSLLIQGVVCYLIQYFAAGFFLNPGYPMTTAAGSSAPIGDMMVIVGTWLFGSPEAGWWFMFIQAITVFLALIGTTLSCMCTGARVTYAMGRDSEVPSHFGLLHGKNLTPHRAIWTLAAVSSVVGIFAVYMYLCGPAATDALNTALTPEQKDSFWYPGALLFSTETAKALPNSLLVVTLVSNFGTFMLYMLTCCIAIVAFREHHSFSGIKHMVIPVFGVLANFVCMLFYIVGPFAVSGMSKTEPFVALGVAAAWGGYGWCYFMVSSKSKGRSVLVDKQYVAQRMSAAAS